MGGHAVVVLAAGASTRLGQPKQLLQVDGETLLHRMVRMARGTAPAVLVVVLPSDADALRQALSGQPCTVVINPAPAQGMRSSLETAAPWVADFAHVLVMTCDQPALEAAHLHALLRGAYNASSGCAATRVDDVRSGTALDTHGVSRRETDPPRVGTPRVSETPGVPAVVPGLWFTELRQAGADAGFRARLRALPATSLYLLEAPGLALDIDTPDDLRTARARGLIDPSPR